MICEDMWARMLIPASFAIAKTWEQSASVWYWSNKLCHSQYDMIDLNMYMICSCPKSEEGV